MKLAIVAGGAGTRLREVNADLPKSLTRIAGTTVLAHQLDLARRYGVTEVFLMTGHGSSRIEKWIESYRDLDLRVSIRREEQPMGTAGGFRALGSSWDDTLLVMYGDLLCNIDLQRMLAFHRRHEGAATLFAHPNDHPFDSDLLAADSCDRVIALHRKPHPARAVLGNLVNGAVYLLEPQMLNLIGEGRVDWAHDVFPAAIEGRLELFAYRSSEYLRDMGTPERLRIAEDDWRSGRVQRGSYATLRPGVFLNGDRCLRGWKYDDLFVDQALIDVIHALNREHSPAFLVHHWDDLHARQVETVLGASRVYVDGIYKGGWRDAALVEHVASSHCIDRDEVQWVEVASAGRLDELAPECPT